MRSKPFFVHLIPASRHPRTRRSQVDPVPRPTAALVPLVAGLKFWGRERDGPTKPTTTTTFRARRRICTVRVALVVSFTVPSPESERAALVTSFTSRSRALHAAAQSVLSPHTTHLILIAPPSAHRFSWQLRVAPTIHRHQPSAAPPATRTPSPGERWRRS